jgi:hypothetical protein
VDAFISGDRAADATRRAAKPDRDLWRREKSLSLLETDDMLSSPQPVSLPAEQFRPTLWPNLQMHITFVFFLPLSVESCCVFI